MKVTKQTLSDLQTLADFANLEPGEELHFRLKHREFFHLVLKDDPDPGKWWWNTDRWLRTQNFLREAWVEGFVGGLSYHREIRILLSVPETQPVDSHYATPADIGRGITPFQGAVLHLFQNPWRARFCSVCNKRFVAAESKNKFCTQECSHEASRRRHNEWAQSNRESHRKYMKVWRKKQNPSSGH